MTTAKKTTTTKTTTTRTTNKKAASAKKVAPAKKVAAAKKVAPAKKPVVEVPKSRQAATPRPLVAKVRARRNVVLPFRERLEEAMHRELGHDGPVCHACRMNGSRLAALAAMPAVVAV